MEEKKITVSHKEQMEQLSKELHRPFSRKYPRLRVRASFLDETWCMDLSEMQEWKSDNNQFN